MNIFKKLTIISAIFVSSGLAFGLASPAQAAIFSGAKDEACRGANLSGSNSNCNTNAASDRISSTLQKIINILTIIVGIAAVISIIINGLRFITANGDANSITSARNGVIYSLIGLVIVALAQVIVRFIIQQVD